MEAIVLAGGLGTRLQSVIIDRPKPMAPIGEYPFLYYILKWLKKNGITRVILSVGYKWESIQKEFGENFNSMDLVYSIEDSPLGTGGAISLAMKKLFHNQFFIINGDTYFDIKLDDFLFFHQSGRFDFSIGLKPMKNFERYGTVEIDEKKNVIHFNEKIPKKDGLINGGLYVANQSISKCFPTTNKFSFENDFIQKMPKELSFGGLIKDNYFIDIGIPEDYSRAQLELPKYDI
jgi:D-glycero-alpha-D-manno-heptose 1-phosphate guanylyltransferase